MKHDNSYRDHQRGSALILVLWISLLLSILLVGIITVSRSEIRTTSTRQETFQTRNSAITALETIAFELATNRDQTRNFISKNIEIDGYTVTVEKSDEAKKLDLNFASEAELTRFIQFLGKDQETAQSLAANIVDWRDADDIARPNGAEKRDYVRARDKRRPANRAFRSIKELSEVLDFDEALTQCALPGITIFGEINGPDPSFISQLYKKEYPKPPRRQSTTRLGTAARVTNAGRRYSLTAKVSHAKDNKMTTANILGIFRTSGNQQKPYEWIMIGQISESKTDTMHCP